MATIQVTVSPEELMQIVDQMPADELADFTNRVLVVKAQRTAATLDATEESILGAIYAAQLSMLRIADMIVLQAEYSAPPNRKTGPKDRLPFSSTRMHPIPQDIGVLLGNVAQHPPT